jgi:hypothetical protein
MSNLIYLQWFDSGMQPLDGTDMQLGVVFPQYLSDPQMVYLQSTALAQNGTFTLGNVRIYADGDAPSLQLLLSVWPAQNAGLDVSFDSGVTWTRFSQTSGAPSDSSTWLPVPARAISDIAQDGVLRVNDTASLLFRVQTPVDPAFRGLCQFRIVADFEVW